MNEYKLLLPLSALSHCYAYTHTHTQYSVRGVLVLHTFDREGRLDNYIREARNNSQLILFRGPGMTQS